jgi:hypothetical protein
MKLSDASATFFGGEIIGTLEARAPEVSETPGAAYRADVRLRGANLAALTAGTPRLRGYFTGTADGSLTLRASGAGRAALLDSLAGEGTLEVRNGQINALNLVGVQKGTTLFTRTAGRFKVAERKLQFEELQLFARLARLSAPDWLVVGAADLSGSAIVLDMRLFPKAEGILRTEPARVSPPEGRRGFVLRGTLDALEITSMNERP